ncbi:MAG: class I SAM-dependent methyltransferase [Sandaracinaceae bacterium]
MSGEGRGVWFDPARIVYEDADLIVVDKPAGVPCQAADPSRPNDLPHRLRGMIAARDGVDEVYLGIHQRLDQETSGLVLYAKSKRANRPLAAQFESRQIDKRYVALTTGRPQRGTLRHRLTKPTAGRVHVGSGGKPAVTLIEAVRHVAAHSRLEVRIETGRTHQIRVQLAEVGCPVLGDRVYGGEPAPRLMLHAWKLRLRHPIGGAALELTAAPPASFEAVLRDDVRPFAADTVMDSVRRATERRWGLAARTDTDAYRLLNEHGDAVPGLAVDVYGPWLVAQLYDDALERDALLDLLAGRCRGVYLKRRPRQANTIVDGRDEAFAPSAPVRGEPAPETLSVQENGIPYRVRLGEGLSTGLFLDQRDNRRRVRDAAEGKRVLNLFSYTCGFSVAAAVGGASKTVSVDASRRLLDWGRENLEGAGFSEANHRTVRADVFDLLTRWARRGESFDLVCVDPPTYSKTKKTRWKSGKDWVRLAKLVLGVLTPGGSVLACSNDRRMSKDGFRRHWHEAFRDAPHTLAQMKSLPCPSDFPPAPGEEAHLKSLWIDVA